MAIKLYRLAKDVSIAEEKLVEYAQQAGLEIKSHLETIWGEDETRLRAVLGENGCTLPEVKPVEMPDAVKDTIAELTQPLIKPAPDGQNTPEPVVEAPPPAQKEAPIPETVPEPPTETVTEPPAQPVEEAAEPPSEEPEGELKPKEIRVVVENPAVELMKEGGATHQVARAKRSDREQQILTKKLEELRHRDRGVTQITRPGKPKQTRQAKPTKSSQRRDRKQE